jgi:hypothetical protein
LIPEFQSNGFLPEGVHEAFEGEVMDRFAAGSVERKRLGRQFGRWMRICRSSGALRFCLNGSFVTAKESPNDVDAVVLLGSDFADRVARGNRDAIELSEILGMRPTEHLFAAEDRRDWDDWMDSRAADQRPRTRSSRRRKGIHQGRRAKNDRQNKRGTRRLREP